MPRGSKLLATDFQDEANIENSILGDCHLPCRHLLLQRWGIPIG
jgi:hypothetical protein